MTLAIGIAVGPRKVDYLPPAMPGFHEAIDAGVELHVTLAPTTNGIDMDRCRAFAAKMPSGDVTVLPAAEDEHEDLVRANRGLEVNTDRLYQYLIDRGNQLFVALQDDIEFCPAAIERIAFVAANAHKIGALGLISFYTPYTDGVETKYALWRYIHSFYAELALLWTAKAARHFLAENNQSNAHDLEIAAFMRRHPGYSWLAHHPDLVQHIGIESATGKEWANRQSRTYSRSHHAVKDARHL